MQGKGPTFRHMCPKPRCLKLPDGWSESIFSHTGCDIARENGALTTTGVSMCNGAVLLQRLPSQSAGGDRTRPGQRLNACRIMSSCHRNRSSWRLEGSK